MAEKSKITVGSRKSQLALIQTHFVVDKLKELHPEITFEIVSMSTIGDKILDRALSKIGEKSLFTKELEIALEQKVVDLVVHSLKDLPTSLPEGMAIASVLERDDPRDAVVFHPACQHKSLRDLPENSVIGTSSLRRVAQLKMNFPQLKFENIRGNLNTRLKKLDDQDQYTAIVLAQAGLVRMGWYSRIDQVLDPVSECMYAISQGALGVECRSDDERTVRLLSSLSHGDTVLRCVAERAFLKTLEGGCTVPVAVHSSITTNTNGQRVLSMTGGVFSLDGQEAVTAEGQQILDASGTEEHGKVSDSYVGIIGLNIPEHHLKMAGTLGKDLARSALEKGAKPILDKAKEDHKIEQERLKGGGENASKNVPKWANLDANTA